MSKECVPGLRETVIVDPGAGMKFEKENGSFAAALKELGIGRGDLLTVSSDITTLLFRMSTEYGVRGKNERNAALDELKGEAKRTFRYHGRGGGYGL